MSCLQTTLQKYNESQTKIGANLQLLLQREDEKKEFHRRPFRMSTLYIGSKRKKRSRHTERNTHRILYIRSDNHHRDGEASAASTHISEAGRFLSELCNQAPHTRARRVLEFINIPESTSARAQDYLRDAKSKKRIHATPPPLQHSRRLPGISIPIKRHRLLWGVKQYFMYLYLSPLSSSPLLYHH